MCFILNRNELVSVILSEIFPSDGIHDFSCRFLFTVFLVGNRRFLDILEHGGHPILESVQVSSEGFDIVLKVSVAVFVLLFGFDVR